jgi:uncharacterized membrane protein YqhA
MEKQKLNATIVYVLAILGFLCCCFGGLGFIFAGIAYFMAQSKLKEAYANPENYENIEGMKTAKTVALVVLIINILFIALLVYKIYEIGGWEVFVEKFREAYETAKQNQ